MWFLTSWLFAICLRLMWRVFLWRKLDQPYTPNQFYRDTASLSIATILLVCVYWMGKLMLLY